MGRIRTVKPELFLHDELHDIEKETGLPVIRSFIGLFTVCDRSGRFVWKPRILKTQIAPYDDIDFSQVMDALKSAGFILHYQVDGREYGCIPTWEEHQTINNREAESKIPTHDEGVVLAQEASPPRTTNSSTRQVQDRDASLQCTTKPTTRQEKDCDASLQCTSMHKYAQGEGKGREGERNGKEKRNVELKLNLPLLTKRFQVNSCQQSQQSDRHNRHPKHPEFNPKGRSLTSSGFGRA